MSTTVGITLHQDLLLANQSYGREELVGYEGGVGGVVVPYCLTFACLRMCGEEEQEKEACIAPEHKDPYVTL